MSFRGQFEHSVDAKGRVAIPAQFRRDLGGGAVISVGPGGRLVIWPTDDAWQAHRRGFRLTGGSPADQRDLLSFIQSRTWDIELDGQGRLLLSSVHREFAGIRDRATFIGMEDHIEVQAAERWERSSEKFTEERFTALYDLVNPVGAAAPTAAPS